MKTLNLQIAGTVVTLILAAAAIAQPVGGNIVNNAGLATVKNQIHATDEEWKVIGPLLESVVTSRQTAEYSLLDQQGNMNSNAMPGGPNGGMRGGFGGGGPGGPGGDRFAGPGGFGGGGRGGFGGGPGGGGPGGDSFADPGDFGPGGRGGMGRGGRGGFGLGGGPDEGGTSTNGPAAIGNAPNFNGPMGGGFPGMGGANNTVALALNGLQSTLSATNATMAEIQDKMAAVREARRKAIADLAAAEKNLHLLLTLEQEVVLVSLGYLD